MRIIPLYKYMRPNGGITVSPTRPDTPFEPMYRLVADAGMTLTDGKTIINCVDVASTEDWREVEAPAAPDVGDAEDYEVEL